MWIYIIHFICSGNIILSILFSNVGLHPVDVSNPRYMDSLYKNFIGITKISINDFVKKNKSIFMSYDGIHLDYAFVNLYCVPYAFANDGTALIRIDDYGISCLINKKGYVIKFIDN